MNNKENQNTENIQQTADHEQETVKNNAPENVNQEKDQMESQETRAQESDPVAELQAQVAECEDKYKRLYAEFDNFRKRNMRERSDLVKNASHDLIASLLPVLDDFERAIKANKESNDIHAVKEGFKLIHHHLFHILESKGLKPMDSKGKDFDVNFHEAITSTPVEKRKLVGKVVDVIEKGYFLNDNVVRYAKVVIGK